MEPEFIVIIVLLVFMVVLFLAIVIGVAISIAKVQRVVEPITSTVRTIRRVGKTVKGKARAAAQHVREGVRSDLRSLNRGLHARIKNLKLRLAPQHGKRSINQIIERGIGILSGNPCSKLEQLWINHINLTFYYGIMALAYGMDTDRQQRLDYTAGELLQIQQDLSDIMAACVTDAQRQSLTALLKDHILIVAQIASAWRQNQTKGFDAGLVQKWYKNAEDTVQLLGGDAKLASEYKQHLDITAQYLQAIAEDMGTKPTPTKMPTPRIWPLFANAISHAPMLAKVFCEQRSKC